MIIIIVLCAMPFFIGLTWLCKGLAFHYFAKTPSRYFGSAIAIGIIPPVTIALLLVLIGLRQFTGICYGLDNNESPCSTIDFIFDQMWLSMYVVIPILILNLPTSLIIFVLGWKTT